MDLGVDMELTFFSEAKSVDKMWMRYSYLRFCAHCTAADRIMEENGNDSEDLPVTGKS